MSKKKTTLSRREFIIATATIASSAALAQACRALVKAGILEETEVYLPLLTKSELPPTTQPPAPTLTPSNTPEPPDTPEPSDTPEPVPTSTPGPLSHQVVHIRHASATNWSGSSSPTFYQSVNQSAVNSMVQSGLQTLTGQTSWSAIWGALFTRIRPGGYVRGQKIGIKVNMNNSPINNNTCASHNNTIDALPQPVIALLTGLSAAGVQNSDVIVFDASGRWGGWEGKPLPEYFTQPIKAAFPGVSFVGRAGCTDNLATTYGKDPSLTVSFPNTQMQDRHLADLFYDATYLINMPILKAHSGDSAMPVTLGFKNHLGSIDNVYTSSSSDSFHSYIDPLNGLYNPNSNPMVTLYAHPYINGKTILTVGDGLFGAFGSSWVAQTTWSVFGNQPANSLFFAMDPVAIDCVMADILRAAGAFSNLAAYDYMFCAEAANLGVCEGTRSNPGGNPFQTPYGSGYSEIDYVRQDLS